MTKSKIFKFLQIPATIVGICAMITILFFVFTKINIPALQKTNVQTPAATYTQKEVPELNIFMEYKDAKGTMFFSRRELKQEKVPSGAFYGLKVGAFHPPTVLVNDGVDFHSGPTWNGDRIEGKFQIQTDDQLKIVMIGISRTFLSTWGFTEIDFIKQAILELGFRKVRKMIKENKVEDYVFISDNFPQEYQNGIRGYQLLRDSL